MLYCYALPTYRDISNTSRIMEMKLKHSIALISVLFCLGCSSGGDSKCKEVEPEIKMDKEGNQVKHGPEVFCRPNGFIASKGEWKDGKRHGKWTWWWEKSGRKWMEDEYRSDGTVKHTSWYDNNNGYKNYESVARDGKKEGKLIYYHENGNKRTEFNYKNGKLNGENTTWSKDGKNLGHNKLSHSIQKGVDGRFREILKEALTSDEPVDTPKNKMTQDLP